MATKKGKRREFVNKIKKISTKYRKKLRKSLIAIWDPWLDLLDEFLYYRWNALRNFGFEIQITTLKLRILRRELMFFNKVIFTSITPTPSVDFSCP